MIRVQDPDLTACHRHHAISLLLSHDVRLLSLFVEEGFGLRQDSGYPWELLNSPRFGQEQHLLADIAQQVWDGGSEIPRRQAYQILSDGRRLGLEMARDLFETTGGCSCPNCRRRLSRRLTSMPVFTQ